MSAPEISMIAIVAHGGAIGVKGDQPFHISADFRNFKRITMGKPIVMGRRTFEALPGGALPGRRNIVLTRDTSRKIEGAECVTSIPEAVSLCAGAEELMVIGGGEIYRQAMPYACRLYITEVDADVLEADTFFPEFDHAQWRSESETDWQTDPRSGARFRFTVLTRR